MELKSEVVARKYSVAIPMDAMLRLLDRESIKNIGDYGPTLSSEMDDIMGVYESDYDGHFGAAIYYTVEVGYDSPELHQAVYDLIRKHTAEKRQKVKP